MADQKLKITIETQLKEKGLNKAKKSLKELNKSAKTTASTMKAGFAKMAIAAGVVGGAVFAAKKAFDFGKEGAQIIKVQDTFEALAASVGSSSASMLASLRKVTEGMVADTDLMAAASQFLSMGLANSSAEASELARVAVTLGSAMGRGATESMEQFSLLLANQSIPRLDTFGISAGKVRARIAELRAENVGMTRETAFMTATMEQAEISMAKLGDGVPVDAFTQLEVAAKNTTDEFKILAAEGLGPLAARAVDIGIPIKQAKRALEELGATDKQIAELDKEIKKLDKSIIGTEKDARVWALAVEVLAAGFEGTTEELVGLARAADNADHPVRGLIASLQETTTSTVELSDAEHDALKAAGALRGARMEEARATGEAGAAADEYAKALAGIKLDAFTGALEDTGKPLKFFNETLEELGPQMVFFGGRTADQNRILGEAETKYKNLDRAIVDMRIGLDGLGLTEAERGEKIGEMVAQQQQLIPLMDELSGIYGTANTVVQEATVNEEALTSALYDQLTALGLTPNKLALAAGALGLYNEEQLAAALQAAALTAKIAELGQKVADGDITVMGALDSLKLYAGDLQTVDGSALGASQSINEAREEAGLLQGGSPYDATASVSVSGIGQLREAIGLARALQSFGAAGFDVGAGGDRTPGRQHGGPVAGGSPYIVGERGPELFVPNSSGNIVPNNQMNMGGLTVNVTVSSGNPGMIGSEVGKAVQDMVLGSGMRG